jgi:excisionase family DNA binding protein
MKPESIFISRQIAAGMLDVSLRTLENLIATKQLPIRRIGRRVVISRQALDEFARRDHATTTKHVSQEVAE